MVVIEHARSLLLAVLTCVLAHPCFAENDQDWPVEPPPKSSCSYAAIRNYPNEKWFDGLQVMTRLAHRRYPGSRVKMGVDKFFVSARIFKGSCFASVPFFFDHPGHMETWAVMLVDSTHHGRFISVWAADYVPFEDWLLNPQKKGTYLNLNP